ncbi:flavodoxin [Vagococcus acidifermentans]|uniref:Flavodoxin n=1 Tax=Vagococcus acidifermentans TaxID=564710 RepID=A0A430AVQ9_9ENTE|nr:flavodoxin [Vagococcus acidifermentans]RSU12131.1 flavodoxin [Vagococcus acidifermentans]
MTLAKIVYASMTGNTEEISEIIEEKLQEAGAEVEREECSDVDEDFFEDADICIVATYTYGEGDLPFEFEDFFDELGEQDLDGKIYGVVGSGDKEYGEFYCKSAHDFVEEFEKTGAKKGAETVEIENNAEDEDIELLQKFVDDLMANV